MLRSFLSSSSIRFLGMGLSFIFTILLTRNAEINDVGEIAYNLSFIGMFSVFCRGGLDKILTKKIAQSDSQYEVIEIIKTAFFYCILLCLFFLVLAYFIGLLLNYDALFVVLAIVPFSASSLVTAIFNGSNDNTLASINARFIDSLIKLIMIVVLIYLIEGELNLTNIYGIYIISLYLWSIIGFTMLFKLYNIDIKEFALVKVKKEELKSLFTDCLPLIFYSYLSLLLVYGDVIMLGIMSNKYEVALYDIAFKVSSILAIFVTVANSNWSAEIAALFKRSNINEIERITRKVSTMLGVISLTILVSYLYYGRDFLLLWGEDYAAGYYICLVLICGQVVNLLTSLSGTLIIMSGNQNYYKKVIPFLIFLNMLLNITLIPSYGALGAAISTSMVVAIENIYRYLVCLKVVKVRIW